MTVVEAQVHSVLRAFLREQPEANWQHHLTMARLVTRALRLGKSALIQTATNSSQYALSYLTPALLGNWSVIIVAPETSQSHLLNIEIPRLQEWFNTNKKVIKADAWQPNYAGNIILTTPQSWLKDRLQNQGRFPINIPTIIDQADDLEEWTKEQITVTIKTQDWEEFRQQFPEQLEIIREARIKLTLAIFAHPANPYQCYLFDNQEQKYLQELLQSLSNQRQLTSKFQLFWQQWQENQSIIWTSVNRTTGQFSLYLTPLEIASKLNPIWQQQPVVIIGSFLDWENSAPIYRQELGLAEITSIKFTPHPQQQQIQLYLPDRLSLPNTPQFQGMLLEQIHTLISYSSQIQKPIILLIGDVPLKAQVGAIMAAEFGSRVQVESTNITNNTILVTGWEFWRQYQSQLPTPQLLVIATLPLPSLENPLVAARVAYYKRQRLDWFRLYLLPTALREIQRAVLPLRDSQGVLALLDNRVNYRSYGKQILAALEPYSRYNYLESSWFQVDSQ